MQYHNVHRRVGYHPSVLYTTTPALQVNCRAQENIHNIRYAIWHAKLYIVNARALPATKHEAGGGKAGRPGRHPNADITLYLHT